MAPFERSNFYQQFYQLNYAKLSYESQISKKGHVTYRNFMGSRLVENLKISCRDEIASSHNCSITNLAIDKIDNRYLLSGGVNGTVSLYDLECCSKAAKTIVERMNVIQSNQMTNANSPGFHTTITSLQWFPNDCGLFLSSNLHGEVFLYDTETFQAAGCFKFPGQKVYQARFRVLDPNNPIIAVAVDDGTIHLCDIRIGDSVHIIKGHTAGVSAVDWSPIHPSQLASASYDGTVRVWDVRGTGSAGLMSLDWRQDHTAVADRDTTRLSLPVSRTNISNAHNINQSMNTERRSGNEVSIIDSGSNSSGGSAQNYTIDLTSSDHNHNHTPAIISDSTQQYRYLSTSHNTNTSHRMMIRSTGTASSSLNTHLAKAHESEVLAMRYTPDGNYLLTAGNDSHLRLWNSSSGKLQPTHYELPRMDRRSLPFALEIISPTSKPKDDLIVFPDHSSTGNNLSSAGDLLLVPVHSGTGKVKSILKGHMGGVNSTVYRSKYKQVISAGKDGLILIWEDSRVNSNGAYNNRNHNQRSKQRNTTSNNTSSGSNVLDNYTAMMRNASRRYDYSDTVNSLYIDQNHNTNSDNNANSSSSSDRNIILDAYCDSDAECDDGDDCDTWSEDENITSESADKIPTENSELYRLYGTTNSSSSGGKHRKERKGVLSDALKKYLSQDIHNSNTINYSSNSIGNNNGNNSSNRSVVTANFNVNAASTFSNSIDPNKHVNSKEVDWENVDQLFTAPDTTINVTNNSSSSAAHSKALAATTPIIFNNHSTDNFATTLSGSGRRNTVPNAAARSASNTAGFHTEGSSSSIRGTTSSKKTSGRDEILKQLNKRSKKK